jgi:uncharacterized protein YdaU (DUF1376 family)
MSLPYYKRFPRDFLEGTIGLSFETKGAYAIVLDLIYMRSGRLPDDARYIAGQLGCSVRKWTAIREELIARGKLQAHEGVISNFRADYLTEESRKYQDKQAEIAGKPRKIKAQSQPERSQSEPEPDTTEANAPVVLARPSRADVARGFLAFWSAYPRRVGKDAAAKAFSKALPRIDDPDPLAVILAGIERALPGWDDPQFIPHPSTWLTQGRWADDAPEPRTETRNDRSPSSNRPGSAYAQPSRAERDQSAALRVLAARGALPGPGEGGRVHDLGPAQPAAAGG